MHVLVCICSNDRQFQESIGMIQLCYHTNHCACWPCFVNTEVFLCYKTEKGTLTSPSFIRFTLRVLALLDQVTWTETVAIRGGLRGAMRQRKLGSHTPPCHRRMVITTLFSVFLAALQRRPVLYHTWWLLTVLWLRSSGH